ncbi:MAG: GNAT family N-acetyltransferase [Deltaproteobacteria bacterium]|nr:GNAT family N-acetyltransferase [Deltaproteobacteria bacterium]
MGSDEPEAMRSQALRARRWRIFSRLGFAALRRPSLVPLIVGGATGLRASAFDTRAPELTYIAVRSGQGRSGIGSQLVRAFEQALAARGARRYELSVETANSAAIGFYERHGMVQIGQYRQFGADYRRYAKVFGDDNQGKGA